MARLTEPFIEFFRYLPAPAFGALAVAVLGINDAPKIAIIFIGTFFQQVLVVANTTRRLDPALLEAAQTLGAKPRQLLWRVVVPGIITDLYSDMRVLLGWAWTYLIVAELIGVSSGITFFINQQAKYRAYDHVFASIILIGLIGLTTDVILASIGRQLFPWVRTARAGWLSQAMQLFKRARAARSRGGGLGRGHRRDDQHRQRGRGRRRDARRRRRRRGAARLPRAGARGRRALSQAQGAPGDPGGARPGQGLHAARRRHDARARQRQLPRAPARVHVRDRPVGLRQVDVDAHPRRPRGRDRRRGAARRQAGARARARPRHGLSGLHALPLAHRHQERDVRPRAVGRALERRPPRRRRAPGSSWSACTSSPTPTRTSCRAA